MVKKSMLVNRLYKNATERVFEILVYTFLIFISLIMLYPFLYMLAVSLSSTKDMAAVTFYPRGLHFFFYKFVFSLPSVRTGYINSVLYTSVGTLISLFLTTCCAYPLSKKWLPGRKIITVFIVITMYFNGGLIPYFIIVKRLGLYNNMGAIVIPGAMVTIYMIVMVTFFRGIPVELEESCYVDGANELVILSKIFLPLSKPIIATLALFYSVLQWNSWFGAAIFLNDKTKYPIQLVLRNAMISLSSGSGGGGLDRGEMAALLKVMNLENTDVYALNYALTIAVVLPIIFIYPFLQKYFIKGVMIGSLKG